MNIQIHHWTSGETGFMHKEWIGNSSLSGFSMVPLYSYVICWQSYIGIRKPPYANDKFMYYSFVYFSSIRRYLNVLTQLIEGNYCFLISYVLTDLFYHFRLLMKKFHIFTVGVVMTNFGFFQLQTFNLLILPATFLTADVLCWSQIFMLKVRNTWRKIYRNSCCTGVSHI